MILTMGRKENVIMQTKKNHSEFVFADRYDRYDHPIYVTKNYDDFIFFVSNRDVKLNFKLEREILENNKLHLHPITVTPQMQVIDGQHRLEICRKNDLPVYFMVDYFGDEMDIKDVQAARAWSADDYTHFYASKNYSNYNFIQYLCEKYDITVTDVLQSFARNSGTGEDKYFFKSGKMCFRYDKEHIDKCCDNLNKIINKYSQYLQSRPAKPFKTACLALCGLEGFDLDHFLHKIDTHPENLILASRYAKKESIFLVLFEKIYNFKCRRRLELPEEFINYTKAIL